jgi:enolase-phosphatase E1
MTHEFAASEPQIRAILLDIEGTTTPVDFVTKTLFRYASRKLDSFLREHFGEPDIQSLLRDLRAQHQGDAQNKWQPPPWVNEPAEATHRSAVAYCQWLIARDSKCTPLKTLQGKIWQQGYANGELHGEVYPDVSLAFQRWRAQKKKIFIYSSGSELAQRLLFSTVPSGDLTPHIAGFFDTRIGAKAESESYKKIAVAIGHKPQEILFISDALKETEPAQTGGMQAMLCVRDSAVSVPASMRIIHDLDEVFPKQRSASQRKSLRSAKRRQT